MALDIKPTRSELINLKRRIKQTQNGYKLLKMKRDGLFHEFRMLLADMIKAREDLLSTYREAIKSISLASSIEGALPVKSTAIAIATRPEVEVSKRNIMGVVVPSVTGEHLSSDHTRTRNWANWGISLHRRGRRRLLRPHSEHRQGCRNGSHSEKATRRDRINKEEGERP